MNIQEKISDPSRYESGYTKLAMAVLSVILVTAALGKQLAANAADKATATVSVADLDLSTDKGMQAARDRLNATARRLCEKVVDPASLSIYSDYVHCVDEATTAAVAQLTGPVLAANAKAHTEILSAR